RLCLVQPGDPGGQRRPARDDRLSSDDRHTGRHVPPYPSHRGRGPVRQGGVGGPSPEGVGGPSPEGERQRRAMRSALTARKARESPGSAGSARVQSATVTVTTNEATIATSVR